MSDLKTPFVFHNYPLLRFLKLIATSPLINLYPTQMQKSSEGQHSLFFMFFSVCPHLYVRLHSPWFYVTASMKISDHLQYELAQGSHVFSSQKKYILHAERLCWGESVEFSFTAITHRPTLTLSSCTY